MLISLYPEPAVLLQYLRLNWVSTWSGWAEARRDLNDENDETMLHSIAAGYAHRFFSHRIEE